MTIELPSQVNTANVQEYVHDVVWPAFTDQLNKLNHIACWARGEQPHYLVPPTNSPEKMALMELSKTPWLGLVVDTFAQCLYVDGYRTDSSKENVPGPWQTWNANNFKARQVAIHRAALTYGHAYASVTPGLALDGSDQAVLRGHSPRRVFALYDDPVSDDYPRYALQVMQDGRTIRFWDSERYYQFQLPVKVYGKSGWYEDRDGNIPARVSTVYHGIGIVPFIRYLNAGDLDGRVRGEVERLIPVAMRIDKTLYDRMLAQHFNSVKVKTATGVDELGEDASDEDAALVKFKISNEDILMHGNPEVKFGALPETDISHFIHAYESDLETLASNAQLPSNGLTGKLANLSADALASARANTTQKIYERQISFGSSHNQLLRLAAHVEGDTASAMDFEAEVTWQDMEVHSLAQAVDAWGKAATMLGVPRWATWTKIPGVTADEARMWWAELLEKSPEAEFLRYYNMQDPTADENNDPNAVDDTTSSTAA